MSRRDELAAVLGEHREDGSYPDTCCCETTVSYDADGHYADHLADAVLAWLGERLGDEGLREALERALCISVGPGLAVLREWFGVSE